MDYLQLGAVDAADSMARLAPADQQIDQAVLMPQLVAQSLATAWRCSSRCWWWRAASLLRCA
eukprot:4408890-Pyramimonas_sp.AAC.1